MANLDTAVHAALDGARSLASLPARLGTGAAASVIGILEMTGPRSWAASDWSADVIPYLAYFAVTSTGLQGLRCRD